MSRSIARVVRRTTHAEQAREQRTYWAARSVAERLAEVEALRRVWIEQTGDPNLPIARVVFRRGLHEAGASRPAASAHAEQHDRERC